MSDPQEQLKAHQRATQQFIDLANRMANEDKMDTNLISAALMAASGTYATFSAAGNQGYLAETGIERVAEVYKKHLTYIQQLKKEELEAQGLTPKPKAQVDAEREAGNDVPDDS